MPAASDTIIMVAFSILPIPLIAIVAGYFGLLDRPKAAFYAWVDRAMAEKAKRQAYDPKTGLGRGAPGFQTNVRRIAVPRNQVIQTPEGLKILDSPVKEKENEWIPAGHSSSRIASGTGAAGGSAKKAKKRK